MMPSPAPGGFLSPGGDLILEEPSNTQIRLDSSELNFLQILTQRHKNQHLTPYPDPTRLEAPDEDVRPGG